MLLVNGAGGSAANPILAGLRAKFVFAASTMDIAQILDAWLDQSSGFGGSNSVRSSLSPAPTVLLAGTTANYDDATDRLNIGSTNGLSAGDPIYLSHAGISAGIYIIAGIPTAGWVTLRSDPFAGGGNRLNIAYQVGWAYNETIGNAPTVSSSGGTENWFKARVADASGVQAQSEDFFWARNAPAGAQYIALDGLAFNGNPIVTDPNLTLSILSGWANKGGVSHVELAAHSAQGVNNFTFGGGGTGERTITAAEGAGLIATGGDGVKYGRLLLKTIDGGQALGVDFSVTVDTTGPSLTLRAFGA
jgi:hypothetical protein